MRKVFGIGETILDIIFRNDQPQKAVPGGFRFQRIDIIRSIECPRILYQRAGQRPGWRHDSGFHGR